MEAALAHGQRRGAFKRLLALSLLRKDIAMLEVTPSAADAVREYLENNGLDSAVRVTLEGGG